MKPIRLDEEAENELSAAYVRYEAQVAGLGDELIAVVDEQLTRIRRAPWRFPLTPEVAQKLKVRRALVLRFPFSVVFLELAEEIRALAVA